MSASAVSPARTPAALRKSALQLAAFFLVIGSVSWWRGHVYPPAVLWTAAGIVGALGLIAPRAFGPIEAFLIVAGEKIGAVTSPIILGAFYYLVITPTGFFIRLRRDPLNRKLAGRTGSDWIRRTERPSVESYKHQF